MLFIIEFLEIFGRNYQDLSFDINCDFKKAQASLCSGVSDIPTDFVVVVVFFCSVEQTHPNSYGSNLLWQNVGAPSNEMMVKFMSIFGQKRSSQIALLAVRVFNELAMFKAQLTFWVSEVCTTTTLTLFWLRSFKLYI